MWLAAMVCLVVAGAVAFARLWELNTKRGSRPIFLRRPDSTIAEIHETFYAGSAITEEQLARALGDIARYLRVPATKLRPTDRFDSELAPTPGWEFDDEIADLAWIARQSLRKQGVDPAMVPPLLTVDDYVRVISGVRTDLRNAGSEK
jgi:hypothetical protein